MSKELATKQDNPVSLAEGMLGMIERAAMNPDVDVNKMQKLLEMQEHIFNKNAEIEYNKAMREVQSELKTVYRDKANAQTNSKYTSYEKLHAALVPVYTKHGFSLSFGTDDSPLSEHVRILCDVFHADGHTRQYKYDLPLDLTGIKGTPNKTKTHASGSTLSYGRRYLSLLIFNVATTDDADGNMPRDLITDEQVADIQALIDEVGEDGRAALLEWAKIDDISDLPAAKYKQAVAGLEKRRQS